MLRSSLGIATRVHPQPSLKTPLFLAPIHQRSLLHSTASVSLLHKANPTRYSQGIRGVPLIHAHELFKARRIWQDKSGRRSFHSTPSRRGIPLVPIILGALKSSTTIEIARAAGRIALTFIPLLWLQNKRTQRYIAHHAKFHGEPATEEKKAMLLQKIRTRTILFHLLLSVPAVIFWAAIFASFEQTPLTGRWRMIILSPEEEDEIAAQLAGPKWYQAVSDVLSAEGTAPNFIPTSDWRYQWVNNTLRCLERGIPNICSEDQMQYWLERPDDSSPFPPPAQHPLRPRPRASELMHSMCEAMSGRVATPAPHVVPGPPYSLLIVDKPDASNAFSYGFGPDGGGGIVVYSGFLDDVLSRVPASSAPSSPPETSWLSSLFGSLFSVSNTPAWTGPTPEQTSELAILLAHELAHLILSHHLETLSSGTIIFPAVVSMISDVFRTLLFPVTMLFGPFVNDAVAALGKLGSGELTKVGEYCNSVKQEIEADVVSARLLAHAGFDARDAVAFWERRHSSSKPSDCGSTIRPSESPVLQEARSLAHRITGQRHPVDEVRVEKLKGELVRWELERRVALRRLEHGTEVPEPSPALRII